VYLEQPGEWALVPDVPAPERITTDGKERNIATLGDPVVRPIVQMQGWHLAEITGAVTPIDASFALAWQAQDGQRTTAPASHTFALATDDLWQHERTIALPNEGGTFDALRYDLNVHFAAIDGLRVGPDEKLPLGTRVLEERWHAVWTVPNDGVYRLTIGAFRQRFEVRIDGTDPFGGAESGIDQGVVDVQMTAGDHTIEITMEPAADDLGHTGGDISVSLAASDQPVEFGLRPY
jgi:hypothetical protein